jgi:hypothetical protein
MTNLTTRRIHHTIIPVRRQLRRTTSNAHKPTIHLGGCLAARGCGLCSLCDVRLGRKVGRLLIDPPFISSTHHQLSLSSPRSIMSAGPSTSTSTSTSTANSNFASIFNAALKTYERKTKNDLTKHPLLPSLQSCDSPEAILTVLREQIPAAFNQSQNGDDGLTKWVSPTVSVLYAFSATVGQGVGLVRNRDICRGEFSVLTYTLRHSDRQMQYLRGSAFSSWSVSFMCRLRKLF